MTCAHQRDLTPLSPRVVAVPVDTAMRRIIGASSPAAARRVAIPVGPSSTSSMVAPWREPDPVPGVVLRTKAVPATWLRRPPVVASHPAISPTATVEEPRRALAQPLARREPRPMPASVRIRKAAMMAFGLLVSLVAVEAAARVGRR